MAGLWAVRDAHLYGQVVLQQGNDLLERLTGDERLGLTEINLGDPLGYTGAALDQTDQVIAAVDEVVKRNPDAAVYSPAPIL